MKIRAHHLLCIPRFYSGGYDKKFGDNLKKICLEIRRDPKLKITVTKSCDDICHKCPYEKDNLCKKTPKLNTWIIRQDEKVLKRLRIKENSQHQAKEIFNLSMQEVNSKGVKNICQGCVFLKNCIKVGINNSFNKDLNKNSK